MMTNKWVQAVLIGAFGFGMIVGSFILAISPTDGTFATVGLGGLGLMMVSLYKTANARGTDGWGGPYQGPH